MRTVPRCYWRDVSMAVCGTHLYHRIAKPVFTEAQLAQHLG